MADDQTHLLLPSFTTITCLSCSLSLVWVDLGSSHGRVASEKLVGWDQGPDVTAKDQRIAGRLIGNNDEQLLLPSFSLLFEGVRRRYWARIVPLRVLSQLSGSSYHPSIFS